MHTEKPTVVFLTTSLHGGGAERSLLEIFRSLNRKRYVPLLWSLDSQNMYPEYLLNTTSYKVLPLLPTDVKLKLPIDKRRKGNLASLFRTAKPNLIKDAMRIYMEVAHLAEQSSRPIILVSSQYSMNIRVALLHEFYQCRIPVLFIEQNEPYSRFQYEEDAEERRSAWTRIRTMYPCATRIVAVSKAIKTSLNTRFGINRAQITVIYNPVDVKKVRNALSGPPPAHVFFTIGVPVLVCTARFVPLKNHKMLLEAFALAIKLTDSRLILIGQGNQKKTIQDLISILGLNSHVAMIDFQADPFPYIAHADLLVSASYGEGHPLSFLEAFACGVPVVSSRWDGADEIIKHGVNGVLCEMNAHALASGILAGLKLKKLRISQNATSKTANLFNTRKIARQYERLFENLI